MSRGNRFDTPDQELTPRDLTVEGLNDLAAQGIRIPEGDDGYSVDWDQRRQYVYERDDYQCRNCGVEGGPRGDAELHAHHIVPKSQGGSHHTRNLATLCEPCHDDAHPSFNVGSSRTRPMKIEEVPDGEAQAVLRELYTNTTMSEETLEMYADIVARHRARRSGDSPRYNCDIENNADEIINGADRGAVRVFLDTLNRNQLETLTLAHVVGLLGLGNATQQLPTWFIVIGGLVLLWSSFSVFLWTATTER